MRENCETYVIEIAILKVIIKNNLPGLERNKGAGYYIKRN